MSFADALALLGVESARVAAVDRALGGALNLATGGVSGTVVGMVSERGRILGLGRDAVRGVGARLGRAGSRTERGEVVRAAHAVIVIVAWFEVLEELELPFSLSELELTREEQLALVGGASGPNRFPLFTADLPFPSPHMPPESLGESLLEWFDAYAGRMLTFIEGLALWERLTVTQQRTAAGSLFTLDVAAVNRYRSLFLQLAVQVPEFAFWVAQNDHQATRVEVRRALDGIDTLLAATAHGFASPVDIAAALARHHEAVLDQLVLDASTAPEGIRVPTLRDLYLDPDFRIAEPSGQTGPADESWWDRHDVRHDLTRYLAGALTNPGVTAAPLLVLGQPGAGKSVLTRVLAARLPDAGFLPVRVPLRDVRAEDELQDQIEQAIRAATGERTTWPELVRSARGAVPVLLLDGFDELLQTTGVHHTDFLIRVARFQQREAEQGRPVVALVTSRTSVADRARYPQGMVALRLEPFRPEQIQRWLAIWNEANAHTLRPLTWEAVTRHAELASQPLLLTMLALYDATEGRLNRDGGTLDVTELYEELLSSFARREVRKATRDAVPDDETAQRVEQELQRLSLVAFALVNRNRQWVSAAELDEDLTALLGKRAVESAGFRAPLGAADVALGRFFFVQRAQSVRGGQVLSTYEFLHATFSEYLVVRLALRLLTDLLAPRPSLSLGASRIDDDLVYSLLSYAPLSSRQMLRFARELAGQRPAAERDRLARQLIKALRAHRTRTTERHVQYRPSDLRTASRHGLYGANLVLMIVVLLGRTTVAEVFPDADEPVHLWNRHCLLWRSAMDEEQWTDFALTFTTRRHWGDDGHRALEIILRDAGPPNDPQPIDANWLFGYPEGHGGEHWQRTYWPDIWHKMSLAGPTPEGIVRHAMDPVFRNLGLTLTTFLPEEGKPAASVAHELLSLTLDDPDQWSDAELVVRYDRLLRGLNLIPMSSDSAALLDLLLTAYRRDQHRLPAASVNEFTALGQRLSDYLASHTPPSGLGNRLHRILQRHYPELFDTP
ncbi:hypothetical protein GTY65_04760 [Streptomyces sp. SID8379]|uniref:NACHT domain-containing protein n=1 Tax=unclassified Streptomyces TaxID=2593676 RepID=UPI00131A0E12|nr:MULTISPECIES: hypothetical protein [unclassified Streptomyces]MYW63390.1 hypothetical protein [Streptomyces sp. SID8379]